MGLYRIVNSIYHACKESHKRPSSNSGQQENVNCTYFHRINKVSVSTEWASGKVKVSLSQIFWSAPDAILELKKWIAEARRETKHSVVVSLDVKSAFSRVWWPKVLQILQNCNCPSNLFKIISSFLDDRQVSLQYGDVNISQNYTVGCPQGSNSGPLYWLLIANEARKLEFPEEVRLLAYADDFYLFVKATGKHTIQEKVTRALEQLDLWGKNLKLSFAHEKTSLIPFGKKGRLTIAKHHRGLSGKVVKLLYKRALERILVYAAPAWWTGSALQRTKATSIQRQVLLALSGAFRTTSTKALQVCCGTEPIDLVLDMEVAWYALKHHQEDVSFFGTLFEGSKMEHFSPSLVHPGLLTPVHWDGQQPDAPLSIFTDGSKLDGRVGAAFVVHHNNSVEEHRYRLSDHCSVFQAETVALQQALKWKKQNAPNEGCHIFSDSMSVLMSLQNHLLKSNQVQLTRQLLDASVSLHWVKAHIGIAGNEEADRAAKAATQKEGVDVHLGIPERSMKRMLKEGLMAYWQTNWDSRDEGPLHPARLHQSVTDQVHIEPLRYPASNKSWAQPTIPAKI
ncbi:hypothetical protein AVEN_168616-1 [Araneus ventricosus]|uniref:Retrovirus-related Pol polyprotein from type-1 retrotransposable element R1 n=1 Tax=Araneus ventricosus TaxID=182803 RepID=A0A4Y2SI61_ARAVE|nr:hypothetical protein AVEN_168616-1 [Araneus ventricosus]